MKARDKSRIIQWATGFAISLVMVFLFVGNGLCQDDLEQAVGFHRQAMQLYQKGRYEEAIPLAKRVLAILENDLGSDHLTVTTGLNDLAALYHSIGDYSRAEPLYKRSLAIRKKALEPDHPAVVLSLNNLAALYNSLSDYSRAEPLYKRALAIWEKSDHPNVATGLNNLAELYKAIGDYKHAEPLFKRALAIYEDVHGPDHPDVATILNNLAALYNSLSDYSRAEPLFKRALTIREKALRPDHPDVAQSLNNLAVLYNSLGDYRRAELLLKRALTIDEKALGPDHPDVGASLNNLALFYDSLGDYSRAEPLFKRSLAIDEKALGPDHPNVATGLNNLAELYRIIGDYSRAEPLFKRALTIREKTLGPDHPDVGASLNNLASLYGSIGDYSRAEPFYKRALAILENTLGPDHPKVDGIKSNIGILYLSQGKLDEAYESFKGYTWSTGLGLYYLLKKEHGRAEEQYRKLLDHHKKTRESTHLLASYIGLGLSLEGMRQYPDAANFYQQAVELMEEQRAVLSLAGRTHFLSGEVGAGFKRILAYEGLVRAKGKLKDPAGAFFWSEYTKARLLLEAMARGKTAPGLPSVLAQKEETLTTHLAGLYRQREAAFAKNPAIFKEIEEKELPQAKKKLARFIETLRQDYPVYAAIRYPAPIPVADLSLRPNEVLIAYEVTKEETYAWLVRDRKVAKAITIPVTRKELIAQVKQYRTFFEGVTGYDQLSRFDPRMGKELYDLLFKDLAANLKDGEHIILVPDEILGILPFEALVAELPARVKTSSGRYGDYPQGLSYLGDLYPISYYQSAAALWVARTLQKSGPMDKEKMLVVADPVFELADARVKGKKTLFAQRDEYQMNLMRAVGENWQSVKKESPFPRLSVTGLLAEKLRHSYGKSVDVLKGLDATEQKLRKQPLDQYRYQVFATHGILDNEIPYIREPALVLSQIKTDSQDRQKDGFLTMTEVMDLKFNADVAALTACNTGVGKNLTGEGVMGMGRAFQYAGARSVLMSLWSVEDESTNLLTERFFSYLKAGEKKLEALRHARADVRKAGYKHPFFWAPFILVGER